LSNGDGLTRKPISDCDVGFVGAVEKVFGGLRKVLTTKKKHKKKGKTLDLQQRQEFIVELFSGLLARSMRLVSVRG
jgi:hypothetical protein